MKTWQDKLGKANALVEEMKVIMTNPKATQEERESIPAKIEEVKALKAEVAQLKEIRRLGIELAGEQAEAEEVKRLTSQPNKFSSLRDFWVAVHRAGSAEFGFRQHGGLRRWKDSQEPGNDPRMLVPAGAKSGVAGGWSGPKEAKATMAEATGATGGFLVPVEFLPELYALMHEKNIVRQRATIIPMRRRQIAMPVLDQTSTVAGQPHSFGGILATWTEESGQKDQNDPTFRQIQLVAHKLVCYTRASDELLDDSAIGLDAFLRSNRGFAGAIAWFEEYAFFQGTGAGQPLGVINAGATIPVVAAALAITVPDIMSMVQAIQGDSPIWHISRGQMASLMQLNGPAANPTYIFIPNAREGMPSTLMGFPIHWTEKLPAPGQTGDVLLANWEDYFIGDRQATTIESTNIERFRYDETSWRAVHRVDGQPGLSAPLTLADGTTQVSPFVIRGAAAS